MIIKSISLRNIRSYLGEKIEFPAGSTLLSGDVGSGKSSILLALEFALFGLKRGELSGTSLLRHGKKEGYVELKFEINKKDIIIRRALKRSSQGVQQVAGYIIMNGVKTEATAVELKTRILELFGYPQSFVTKQKDVIFRYTVYTPQEHMKHILFEDKDARLDTLRIVFDIDKYKRIRDNAHIFIKDIKNKKAEFSGSIADLPDKNKELKQKKQELRELDRTFKDAGEQFKKASKEAEKAKKELEILTNDEKQYENLKLELNIQETKLQEKVQQVEKNKNEAEQLDKQVAELKQKVENIKIEKVEGEEEALQKEIEAMEKEVNAIETNKALLTQKLDSNKKKAEDLQKEINEKQTKLREFETRVKGIEEAEKQIAGKNVLQQGIEKMQQEIEEVNNLIGECKISITNAQKTKENITKNKECPICLQPISEEHKHNIEQKESKIISDKEVILKEAAEKRSEASKQLEESRKKLEQVREKESELQALKVKLELCASLEKEINDKKKVLGELAKEIAANSGQLEQSNKLQVEKKKIEIRDKKEFVRKMREIEKLRKEKDNLNNMLNDKLKTKQQLELEQDTIKKNVGEINRKKMELNSGLEKFRGIEDRLKKTKEEYEKLSTQEKDAEIATVAAEKEKQGVEKITELLEREIALKKGIKEKLNNLSKTQNWLDDFFINLIEVMEKHVMAQLYNEFNELFQNWFRVLIEDENISVSLDDTFTPVIEQNGYETFLENLSGGEKTSCALAYRLALNKVINDFVGNINTKDIIILDEPTDGFSTEQLDRIRDVLDQIKIKQVLVVSHEPKIESFVDNVIRIAKHEHISSIV